MKDYTAEEKNSINGNCECPDGVVCFTVFGEPVSKLRPRTVRGKSGVRTYTPEKTKKQEDRIASAYKLVYGDFKFEKDVSLLVAVKFFVKMPKNTSNKKRQAMLAGEIRPAKKPDIDNYYKLVTDACNGVAYDDDSQIVEMMGSKYYSAEPRTEITIAVVSDETE